MHSVHKIAVFRALYLGDMLCIIPTVRAIRKAWPDAFLTLVGLPWQEDLLHRFPRYFDRFIRFPGWPGLPEQPVDARRIVEFLTNVQNEHFDLVFQLQGNGAVTNALCTLWGAARVCGLRRTEDSVADPSFFPISDDGEHEVLRFFKLLDCLGIPRQGTTLEFPISQEENARYEAVAREAGLTSHRYVCIHPGARDPRRRWPVENFAALAEAVATRGFTPVLTGSADEKELLQDLQSRIAVPVVNIVERFGHLRIGELAAVLNHARLLVSNDTGVSHVAAALRLPSIVIFSPYSHFERWRPLNETLHIAIPAAEAHPLYVIAQALDQLSRHASTHGVVSPT